MKRLLSSLLGMLLFGLVSPAANALMVWETSVGGNGHSYEIIITDTPLLWEDARTHAENYMGYGGHLATVTSAAENNFIKGLANFNFISAGRSRAWLGGYQLPGPTPTTDTDNNFAANWKWVTGEPFSFAPWDGGQPDNDLRGDGVDEDRLHYLGSGGNWNDIYNTEPLQSYVLEVPEPSVLALMVVGLLGIGFARKIKEA